MIRWSKELILYKIKERDRQGKSLNGKEVNKDFSGLYSASSRFFGSWKEALKEASLLHKTFNHQEIIKGDTKEIIISTRDGDITTYVDSFVDLPSSVYLSSDGYAMVSKNYKHIRLSRHLMNITDPKIFVDHIDNNPLNNRLSNLRVTDYKGNNKNQKGAKGYSYDKARNKWISSICIDGKQKFLGRYDSKEEARKAYVMAKITYHGDMSPLYVQEEYKDIEVDN